MQRIPQCKLTPPFSLTVKASEGGGAVAQRSGSDFVYDNCLFRNNSANQRMGGAVDMQSSGYAVFRSCNFTTCSASVGSALNIFGTKDNVILEDSLFTKNVADHGTVTVSGDSAGKLIVNRSIFVENRAKSKGGSIYASTDITVQIDKTQFFHNTGGEKGGALFLSIVM